MDESDSDQILTIEELRSLRDRMGAEAAAPAAVRSAAKIEVPDPPAAIPLQTRVDPWEDLRRRARDRRHWARPLAAAVCLALAGGVVTVLVIAAHNRAARPSAPPVLPSAIPAPAVSAPPVTASAPLTVPSALQPAFVPPAPIVTTPSQPADHTTEPRAAPVPAPRAPHRPKPPTAARPSPTGVAADTQPHGAAADQPGAPQPAPPCTTGCPTTLTKTPTSWSPSAP